MPLTHQNTWVGKTIGDRDRYLLENHLGGGSMGDVWQAFDTILGQSVAIKILKPELVETEELRRRFENEVAVSAALKNDNIVLVSDYGVTEKDIPYYVMEYLEGETLGQILRKEKRLDINRSLNIISQVCNGLEIAHSGVAVRSKETPQSKNMKVVHRDLKPDNIFLIAKQTRETVKIFDFGIAKIRKEQHEQTYHTDTFIGTFHYASPEQIEVEKGLDARSDIYSLGVILYEMLSGTNPFGLSQENPISQINWAMAHVSKPIVPIRTQPDCQNISLALEKLLMRCLAKKPDERFSTVQELRQALITSGQDSTIHIDRASGSTKTPKPQSQKAAHLSNQNSVQFPNSFKFLIIGLIATLTLGAVGYISWQIIPLQTSSNVQQKPAPNDLLQKAKQLAKSKQYTEAISNAQEISQNNRDFATAQTLINQWSEAILQQVTDDIYNSTSEAELIRQVSKVETIPISSTLYQTAQKLIQAWTQEWNAAEQWFNTLVELQQLNAWQDLVKSGTQQPNFNVWAQKGSLLVNEAEKQIKQQSKQATQTPFEPIVNPVTGPPPLPPINPPFEPIVNPATGPSSHPSDNNSAPSVAPEMTREEYNQLQLGMSYNDIVAIVQSPGEPVNRGEIFSTFNWSDGGNFGVDLTFKRDRLIRIGQYGF